MPNNVVGVLVDPISGEVATESLQGQKCASFPEVPGALLLP